MNITQLSPTFKVSPQITVDDVTEAKEQGIAVIVCNRPDGESDDQIPAADIRRACESAGIKFVELPMNGPNYSPEQVSTLKSLIDDGSNILAYCRTGNRSSILYNATQGSN
ncbi:TIGR01244 family sulfur transferase [Saccharospirillum impatiens]|uniref:TIGR01244 family sulfur transferase n=1 Tax=Saccharospirillum impatiens TaxID=169438 RepID=UPI0003F9E122|nr:TIGR01244 family sulfur transferase [Saccharospirillum impatiens]